MGKFSKKDKPPRTIHAEDARLESGGIQKGRRARAFCLAHAEALVPLIGTYSDVVAEDMLAQLRETFWSDPEKWTERKDDELRAAIAASPAPGKEP